MKHSTIVKKQAARSPSKPASQILPSPRKRPVFFNGRLLNADELHAEQNYVKPRAQLLKVITCLRKVGLRGTVLLKGASKSEAQTAVRTLAREAQRPLYLVNLAQAVSKHIGETEKNLSEVFATASASAAILFFDEADALFGRRTKVTDSHDRYANLAASYLLQRMEEHDGLVIVTTGRKNNIDAAFLRRFQVVIPFKPASTGRTSKPKRKRTKRV